jgi:hypothetical protein
MKPLIIKMGNTTKKQIRSLKKGEGKLDRKVNEAIEMVKEELGKEAEGKEILPVVLTYRLKSSKKNAMTKWMKW